MVGHYLARYHECTHNITTACEKRWKDCDQPFFLLALVLNPFEQLSRFGEKAGISRFRWKDMLLEVCQHLASIF